jgi:hypothetical protein
LHRRAEELRGLGEAYPYRDGHGSWVTLRLTAAVYKKLAQEDPARAIAELTADDSPHPLVPFLPAAVKGVL